MMGEKVTPFAKRGRRAYGASSLKGCTRGHDALQRWPPLVYAQQLNAIEGVCWAFSRSRVSDQYGMPTNDDRVLVIGDGNVRIQFWVCIKRYTFLVIRERGWNHVCSLSDQDSQRGGSLLPGQMQWEQDPHNFVLVLLQSRVELIDKERCIQLYRLTYTRSLIQVS